MNLKDALSIRLSSSEAEEAPYSYHEGAYADRLEVPIRNKADGLFISCGEAEYAVAIQPNLCSLYEDRKVLFAMSQNNDLTWISDWARFYAFEHGTDGFLIYNHISTIHSSEDIRRAILEAVPGAVAEVVYWPFPYGVFDIRKPYAIDLFDSCYCQCTIFEHARLRFFRSAHSVVNADIDELIVSRRGESIHDLARSAETGYLCFGGKWMSESTTERPASRRHKDFIYFDKSDSNRCEKKWAVDPSRCPDLCQWTTHKIFGMDPDPASSLLELRHFKAINTNWTNDACLSSEGRVGHGQDQGSLVPDLKLIEAFTRCFKGLSPEQADIDNRSDLLKAYSARLKATDHRIRGDLDQAAAWAKRASELLPSHPSLKALSITLTSKCETETQAWPIPAVRSLYLIDPAFHIQQGRCSLQSLKMQDAEEHLLHAKSINPLVIDIYELLFELYEHEDRVSECHQMLQEIYHRSIEADQCGFWLYRLALLLRRAGMLREATVVLDLTISKIQHPAIYLTYAKTAVSCCNQATAMRLIVDGAKLLANTDSLFIRRNTEHTIFETFLVTPRPDEFCSEMGAIYLQRGDYSSAYYAYKYAMGARPTMNNALQALKPCNILGKKQEASELSRKAIHFLEIEPTWVSQLSESRVATPVRRLRCRSYAQSCHIRLSLDLGDYEKVTAQSVKMIRSSYAMIWARVYAIESLIRIGQATIAKRELIFAQRIFEAWRYYSLMALCQRSLGNDSSAFEYAKRSLEINYYNIEMHQMLASLSYIRGDIQLRKESLMACLRLYPYSESNYVTLLQLLRYQPDWSGLEEWSRIARLHMPWSMQLRKASGDYEEAISAIRSAVKRLSARSISMPERYSAIESILEDGGEKELPLLDEYIASAGLVLWRLLYYRGWLLLRRSNWKAARENLEQALSLEPRCSHLNFLLGRALYASKDYQAAAEVMRRASRLRPDSIYWRYVLADAYVKAHRLEDAVIELDRILEVSPNHHDAIRLRESISGAARVAHQI